MKKIVKKTDEKKQNIFEKMIEAGVHFGHQPRKRNPKMDPYILYTRDGFNVIDILCTYFELKKVSQFLMKSARQGKTFLFVGTSPQATTEIKKAALHCGSYYVNQRWLGGILTNWKTIKKSIGKLHYLESREKRGTFECLPKKESARYKKQRERLEKYLGGLQQMFAKPDVVIIVGQSEEINAVRECKKLGICTVTLLDTDCDPTLADFFVPANDDSASSIKFILSKFAKKIKKGKEQLQEDLKTRKKGVRKKRKRKLRKSF